MTNTEQRIEEHNPAMVEFNSASFFCILNSSYVSLHVLKLRTESSVIRHSTAVNMLVVKILETEFYKHLENLEVYNCCMKTR